MCRCRSLLSTGCSHVLSINGMWEESFVGVFHNLLYGIVKLA